MSMDLTNIQVKPTAKDFVFYSKFFMKQLQDERDSLNRWVRFTEKRIEDVEYHSDIYFRQKEQLEKYNDKLKLNNERMNESMNDENEYFLSFVTKQLILKEKQVITSKKKKENAQIKKEIEKTTMSKFYASESRFRRQERYSIKEMNRFHERMIRIDEDMPSYMKQALDNMPANKGYIYKGVWYFGHIPVSKEEEKYLTMFERVKGIQYIHEYIYKYPSKTYNLYEKLAKTSPKTLVHTENHVLR